MRKNVITWILAGTGFLTAALGIAAQGRGGINQQELIGRRSATEKELESLPHDLGVNLFTSEGSLN